MGRVFLVPQLFSEKLRGDYVKERIKCEIVRGIQTRCFAIGRGFGCFNIFGIK